MDDYSDGPAVECDECGTLSPMPKGEAEDETCPLCGEYAREVVIAACPNGGDCDADDHDHGRGVHVRDA